MAFARDIHSREANDSVRLSVVWEIQRGAFFQRRRRGDGESTIMAESNLILRR